VLQPCNCNTWKTTYVSSGLHEEEKKGSTERLQVWNQPILQNLVGHPTDEVILGSIILLDTGRISQNEVWAFSQYHTLSLNKVHHLRERLCTIQEEKVQSPLNSVGTLSELKKAAQSKSLLNLWFPANA